MRIIYAISLACLFFSTSLSAQERSFDDKYRTSHPLNYPQEAGQERNGRLVDFIVQFEQVKERVEILLKLVQQKDEAISALQLKLNEALRKEEDIKLQLEEASKAMPSSGQKPKQQVAYKTASQDKVISSLNRKLSAAEQELAKLKQDKISLGEVVDSKEKTIKENIRLLEQKEEDIAKLKAELKEFSQADKAFRDKLESTQDTERILKKLSSDRDSLIQELKFKDRRIEDKNAILEEKEALIKELNTQLKEAKQREKRLLARLGQTHQTIASVAEELKYKTGQEKDFKYSMQREDALTLEKEPTLAKEEIKSLDKQIKPPETQPEEAEEAQGQNLQFDYFMAPDDIIEVFVWQNPDLSKDVKIGPDGKISYPLVGRTKAAGLTCGQLEKEIKEGLSKYIKNPQVSVTVKRMSGSKIVVLGEVNYPGIYTYTGSLNLIDAVGIAGDLTESAQDESVMIVRGNLTDNPEVLRINLRSIIREGTMDKNIILRPNDVVYVPKSFIHNFNKFLSNIAPSIQKASEITQLRRDIKWWNDEN